MMKIIFHVFPWPLTTHPWKTLPSFYFIAAFSSIYLFIFIFIFLILKHERRRGHWEEGKKEVPKKKKGLEILGG